MARRHREHPHTPLRGVTRAAAPWGRPGRPSARWHSAAPRFPRGRSGAITPRALVRRARLLPRAADSGPPARALGTTGGGDGRPKPQPNISNQREPAVEIPPWARLSPGTGEATGTFASAIGSARATAPCTKSRYPAPANPGALRGCVPYSEKPPPHSTPAATRVPACPWAPGHPWVPAGPVAHAVTGAAAGCTGSGVGLRAPRQPQNRPPTAASRGSGGEAAGLPSPRRHGGRQGAAGAGGCPEAQEPTVAAQVRGRFAGRRGVTEGGGGVLQGRCTYRWVSAASGRIARGRPPGRGPGRGRRRPTPAGRTPGAAGHSPGSGDTTLLRGREKTGQDEERGQTLPVASRRGTQPPRPHPRRAGPPAANGCGCASPELPLGPPLPKQSHY